MRLFIPCLVAASAQYTFAVAIPEPAVFTTQQPGDFTIKEQTNLLAVSILTHHQQWLRAKFQILQALHHDE
jgi:hypothetical protein